MSDNLTQEFLSDQSDTAKPSLSAWLGRLLSLPQLLRTLGAGVVVASLSVFLLQGWDAGNDLQRYLLLLAQTVLLGAAGLASGHILREDKGARTFLALGLVAVPVNFAILGALLYSQWSWDGLQTLYPAYAAWQAGDPVSALLLTGGAMIVLAALAWLGFMVMARPMAGRLTLLFLALNVALLLPVRDPHYIAWLMLGLTFVALSGTSGVRRAQAHLRTFEGRFARAILWLPPLLILGRTVWLYSADAFVIAAIALMAFAVLRQLSLSLQEGSRWRTLFDLVSLLPAAVAAHGIAQTIAILFASPLALMLPLFVLGFSALAIEISMRVGERAASYRRLAGVMTGLGMLANLVLFPGAGTATASAVVGIGVLIYGYTVEQRSIFLLGILNVLAGLGWELQYALHVFDLSGWGTLAALGVVAIVLASLLERFGNRLRGRIGEWRGRFMTWQM